MFKPDMFLDDIYKLDIDELKSHNIHAIIFDIDNTLVTYDDVYAPKYTKEWFDMLHENGFKTYLVSNNNNERVEKFSLSLKEPFYSKALKPRKKYLSHACKNMGVSPENTALAGDQLFTDIYGGNRMNMYTILVKSISDKEDWFVHLKRYLEKIILKRYK